MDPHWIELQRRFAGLPPGHIPGVYPPSSLANDLIQRERERMERIGKYFSAISVKMWLILLISESN